MRALTMLLALPIALLLAPAPAWAHKPSDSYLTLKIDGQRIDGQWDIALRDLETAIGIDRNGDGQLTWDEVRSQHDAIAAYALRQLTLATEGASCTLHAGRQLIDNHTDGAYTVLPFTAQCSRPIGQLQITYRLFADMDPQHKGLIRIQRGASASANLILGADHSQQTVKAGDANDSGFSDYLRLGIQHIWQGYDHILFLLSLLLPAVLVRRERSWQGAPAARAVIMDVTRIVTAFTVAHSITLTAAALHVVALPSRLVESAIALSVVLAAAHNIVPVKGVRRWMAAFGFGLVHGFGFANVLNDLGLPAGALAKSLVGFNLGVEVGQLALVAVVLPLAYLLRGTWFYRRVVLVGGSGAIALVAMIWLAERAFDLRLITA